MTNDEREMVDDACRDIAKLALKAFRELGATAAVILVDPGPEIEGYIVARGGDRTATMRLVVQGGMSVMNELAKEAGIDLSEGMPDHIKQAMARMGLRGPGTDEVLSTPSRSNVTHLSEFTRKAKF